MTILKELEKKIINLLRKHGPLSIVDLHTRLSLYNESTIYNLLKNMTSEGKIKSNYGVYFVEEKDIFETIKQIFTWKKKPKLKK